MRSDDAIGIEVVKQIRYVIANDHELNLGEYGNRISIIEAGTTPENYLEKIVEQKPDTVVLVDAVDFNAIPGTTKVFKADEITNWSVSTHSSSIKLVMDYLTNGTNAKVFLFGIQPKTVKLGGGERWIQEKELCYED